MKRKFFLALLYFCIVVPAVVLAHPPQDIIINFDKKTGLLTAEIKHEVSDPVRHYIKKVDIGLNGKEIKTIEFRRQENAHTQYVAYSVAGVKPGDKLSVEGYCNLSGKLEKAITVK